MRIATVMLVGIVASSGCKKEVAAAPAAPAPAAAAVAKAAPAPVEDESKLLGRKLNPIIDCMNTSVNRAFEVRDVYLGWATEKGPNAKTERGNLPILVGVDECTAGVAKAVAMPPATPELDAAAQKFSAALTALDALVKPMTTYYQQQSWKDDKFQKGILAHPKLLAAWDAFAQAEHALDSEVKVATRRISVARLERLEKQEGKALSWHHADLMLRAEDLAAAGLVKFEHIDAARFAAAVNGFEASLTAWGTYVDAHKDEAHGLANEGGFRDRGNETLAAAKILLRARQGTEKVSPQAIQYNNETLVKSYNSFIDDSNRLQ